MGREIAFSNEALSRIKKPEDRPRYEFRDRGEAGLFLYVTQTGLKTFYVYRKHQGRALRIKIGRYPDISVSAARKRARELKGQLTLGLWTDRRVGKLRLSAVTLSGISTEYLDAKRSTLKPSSIKNYELATQSLLSAWQNVPLATLTKEQIIKKHEQLTKQRGRGSADNAMRVLMTMFEFFIDRYDFTGANPVKTLSRNKLWNIGTKDRRKSIISNADIPRWGEAVLNLPPCQRDYLFCLFFTGLRKSEAANLLRDDINLAERQFTVRNTKNGDDLILPMSEPVFQILEGRVMGAGSRYVFPSDTNPEKTIFVTRLAADVSVSSGVKFMLHDLRRTFITCAESLDISGYTIKRLVNHKSGGADVTAGYMVFNVDRLRQPAERIAKRLIELGRIRCFE